MVGYWGPSLRGLWGYCRAPLLEAPQKIPLGETELSATEIEKVAWDLGRDFFQAARYNLLMCNCEPCAGHRVGCRDVGSGAAVKQTGVAFL